MTSSVPSKERRNSHVGLVSLVGAGPGDPGLLTMKGLQRLKEADCVIYDSLVNPDLLEHAQVNAELVYAGKRAGHSSISQEEINCLIIERAVAGMKVTRLKGGDPFTFGRGGEEAEALSAAGIVFEIVPGITSGIAAPAYAGIPITHRDLSSSVTFLTGHEDPEKEKDLLSKPSLINESDTLVLFMSLNNLAAVMQNLLGFGRDPQTPVALIQWGTYPRQQVLTGTLEDIAIRCETSGFSSPVITVVGEVVRLRQRLKWFENRPLYGKRIVLTRPREQAGEFRLQLEALGAEAISLPTIMIQAPDSWKPLDEAIRQIQSYQWLIFTSVNGVTNFMQRFRLASRDIRDLSGISICAIGPATAQALREMYLHVEILPDNYRAEGLLESLQGRVAPGHRVLLPRAKVARQVLPQQLREWGAEVHVVDAYQTQIPPMSKEKITRIFREPLVDMIVFTSSSTVENLARLVFPGLLSSLLHGVKVAAIGPVTAQTTRENGLQVDVQPSRYDVPSLIQAILDSFEVRL